jgi:hypothetical protein
MPSTNNITDTELPAPTRRIAPAGTNLPSWWKRATSYALRRLSDTVGGGGRNRTRSGEGRRLLRERRNVRLGRAV